MNRFLEKVFNVRVVNKEVQEFKFNNPTQLDAFGRLRVSNLTSIIEINFVVDENIVQVSRKTTGTATINRVDTHLDLILNTGGDTARLRSRNRGIYEPGKSLLILMTGTMDPLGINGADVTSKIGYYDDDDGYYFEYNNGIINVVERTKASGVVVETRVDVSGSFDPTKANIYWFDLEWLGVGKVRSGIVLDDKFVILHEFLHSNKLREPYMTKASLFVNAELLSAGVGTGSMLFNCASVNDEGGHDPIGRLFSIDNHFTSKTVNTGVFIPLLSMRLKANTNINALLQSLNIAVLSQNASVHYELFIVHDPTGTELTGASWLDVADYSYIEYDISATAFSADEKYKVSSGYLGRNQGSLNFTAGEYNNLVVTKNIDDVSDIVVLICGSLSGAETVVSNILWKEIL